VEAGGMMTRLASEPMHQIETAEELEAGGHPDRARDHLIGLVDTVDSSSDVRSIRRCLDLATRIGARDLALHYALCFWCGWPGHNGAKHALAGAALFHPDRRVAGAGYRICLRRTRTSDWCAIATADDYATWPQIHNLLGPDRHRARTIVQLSDAHLIRPIGPDGTGVWLLGPARVTRAGRSLAVGVDDGGSGDSASYVPGLSVWDPSAALRWGAPPRREAYDRLGLLATQFLYSGYWHWLMEGLLHAVRLDEAGVLQALDRLVICIDGREARLVSESLQAVGIRLTAVELSSTPFDCYARELVVPMRAPGFGGLVDEADPSDFREILLQNTKYHNGADIRAARRRLGLEGAAAPRASRRLFVSRRDAAKRRVVNEDELLTALATLGFEVIVPGALTFGEQVAAFSSADVVVGPHGAGLANAIFMPRGSTIVELHHADSGLTHYERLAALVGLRYHGLACDPDETLPRDMVVGVDAAAARIRALLASP
jgi:Glycosyltransferase 61